MMPNIEMLAQYTQLGIGLAAVNDYGAYVEKNAGKRFTANINDIEKMMAGKYVFYDATLPKGVPIKLFRFIPKEAGFICLDFDIKNGVNGIANFKRMTKNKNMDFANKFNKTTFVKTPNNGYHFYFKSKWDISKVQLKNVICLGVETKYKNALTAAGSMKEGKLYELKGMLKNSLYLPKEIENLLKKKVLNVNFLKDAKTKGAPSMELLSKEAIEEQSGHNHRAFCFAFKCNRCGYSQEQALEFILSNPDVFGTDGDLLITCKSGFSYSR